MRSLTRTAILSVAIAAMVLLGSPVLAFHDGGVATCGGCHSMHFSPASDHLLMRADESSTCLRCHERTGDSGPNGYHISTPAAELASSTAFPKQRTPGGDFGWLRQTLTATATYGATVTNAGYTRGHNIIAADNNYTYVDGPTAPGGSMPAGELSCINCHDPHGRARRTSTGAIIYPPTAQGSVYDPIAESGSYGHIPVAGEAAGAYRLLGGSGYVAFDGGPTFPGNPAAVAPEEYNRTEADTQTRVAYGHGTTNGYASWGKWCATCHDNMHKDTSANLVHVVDDQLNGKADIYNKYVKTGDLTATSTTSFNSLVPFASNTSDVATLLALASTDGMVLDGPDPTDHIACLSCHRAHASGWRYALRWNGETEFLTLADGAGDPIFPGVELVATIGNQGQYNRGYTTEQMEAAYYDRPATVFAAHQRSMCNKCHAKD